MKLTQVFKAIRCLRRVVLPALCICFFALSARSRGDDSHAVAVKPGETVEKPAISAGKAVWVPVYPEKSMIPEVVVATPAVAPVVLTETVIYGRILSADNTPLSGALLYVYNLSDGPMPSFDSYWRVPSYPVAIGVDGRFKFQAPPGEYCFAAIRRADRVRIGPPEAGDVFFISADGAGIPKKYSLRAGEKLDIGDIRPATPDAVSKKISRMSTAIVGRISDYDGNYLEGVMVFAFITPEVIGKPLFVSGRSDKEGNFLLQLFAGGTYYLKARNELGGGPPQNGNIIDGNKLEALAPVSIKTGETVRGIVLKTKKFPGRGRNVDN